MDEDTNLLELLNLAQDVEDIQTLIKSCVEHGVFNVQQRNNAVTQLINTYIKEKTLRYKGLLLLKEYVRFCYYHTYTNCAVPWMTQCLKSFNETNILEARLSLEILALLLEKSKNNVDVSKDAVKNIFTTLIPKLISIKSKNELLPEALKCLEVCMKVYNGPCESYRTPITKYLLNILNEIPQNVELAANCFCLLPGLGGGGKSGTMHKSAFSEQYESLIFILHETLDNLFEDIDELQDFERPVLMNEKLVFPPVLSDSPLKRAQQLARRMNNIGECLTAMHLTTYPVVKEIDYVSMLGLISRGLTVTNTYLTSRQSMNMEVSALIAALDHIHLSLLHLLETLILCCGRHLLSKGLMICKILHRVLDETLSVNCSYGLTMPNSSVREAAYDCFCTWLTVAHVNSNVHMVIDDLIHAILPDIYFRKPTVNLNMVQKVKNKGGKKSKKQILSMSEITDDNSFISIDVTVNKKVCLRALKTLGLIVNTRLLKPDLLKEIKTTIDELLSKMVGGSLETPIPYTDIECRAKLYNLLLTLCLVDNRLDNCFTFFTSGLQDTSPLVISQCQAALSSLEKITHPSAPPLLFNESRPSCVIPDVPQQFSKEEILNMPVTDLTKNLSNTLLVRINDGRNMSEFLDSDESSDLEMGNSPEHPMTSEDKALIRELYNLRSESSSCSSDLEVIEIKSDSSKSDDYHSSDDDLLYINENNSMHNGSVSSDKVDESCENNSLYTRRHSNTDINESCEDIPREVNGIEINVLKRVNVSESEVPKDLDNHVIKKPKLENEENGNEKINEDVENMMKDFVDVVA